MNMENKLLKMILAGGMLMAIVGCEQAANVAAGPDQAANSSKPPLVFDEGSILYPMRNSQSYEKALAKTAVTYYTYFIGSGISSSDYQFLYPNYASAVTSGGYYPDFRAAGNAFVEATYSSRFNGAAEGMWAQNGVWLQTGTLYDNEQAEIHFQWTEAGDYDYSVQVDYEVSSESNYDYLWINGTTQGAGCNSPGSVYKKVSGVASGTAYFQVPRNCGMGWLGIYYIKDGSVSSNGDYARVKQVKIQKLIPVGI
jgi:hypothetical protein